MAQSASSGAGRVKGVDSSSRAPTAGAPNDAQGRKLEPGVLVSLLAPGEWYHNWPAVVRDAGIAPATVRVELMGWGAPAYRTKDVLGASVCLITEAKALSRLYQVLRRGKEGIDD